MNKEELINNLKDYKIKNGRIKLMEKELEKIEMLIEKIKNREYDYIGNITPVIAINNDIHAKNSTTAKTENTAIKIAEKKEKEEAEIKEKQKELNRLQKEIKEMKNIQEEIDIRLNVLNYKEQQIVIAYYIEKRNCEDIGNNLYLELFKQTRDSKTIKRIINCSIKEMLNI